MAFTRSVLSTITNPELKQKLHIGTGKESRVTWIKDNIDEIKEGEKDTTGSLQQTDLLREFYLSIAKHDLKYAYEHASFKPENLPHIRTNKFPETKKVIIVGAGISGLVAALELKKMPGYEVEILEMSQRYGGRVKTLDQKDGYDRGLHTDAGAMRIPQTPDTEGTRTTDGMIHYLTDYYAAKKFGLSQVAFSNYNENAFYNFYGEQTKVSDWNDVEFANRKTCEYWPTWDNTIQEHQQDHIKTIGQYYDATVDVVINLLKKRLEGITDTEKQAVQWDKWTNNWCQFSFGSFMRSNYEAITTQIDFDDIIKPDDLLTLKVLLPWPEAALTAYSVFNYTLANDVSLVSDIQEKMGKWWSDKMHSYDGGLSAIPTAFATQGGMEQYITYNRSVSKVEYSWVSDRYKKVTVSGVITSSGESFSVEGRSVILTVPLHMLRMIEIVNKPPLVKSEGSDAPFPREFQQAIQDISYSPSTKIMLQYKKQFWRSTDSDITGGFSKSNLPIGQLHYPTEVTINVDNFTWDPAPTKEDQKGILMVYTWKAEALMWGALTEEAAIHLAVSQIDQIHQKSKKFFEVGKRQAWASDPTTLGAFAMLRPRDYISVLYLMQNSWRNVYFAGEAISFANGWIHGALGSGLRAAFQLYADEQIAK